MRIRSTLSAALIASALLLAACGSSGGSSGSSSSDKTTTTKVAATKTDKVSIKGFAFSPATISVKAGSTITVTNNDSTAHTFTADNGSFDTGKISPGKSATVTVADAGTFGYRCTIHTSMKGTVVVTK